MKTILVLYPRELENDAEHAMGVLEEEMTIRDVPYQCIGKEIIQTRNTRFVFRDVSCPSLQNRLRKVDKMYIVQSILKEESVTAYEAKEKEWFHMPSAGIWDYIGDIKNDIPTDMVQRYEIEEGTIKSVKVPIYKGNHPCYFESYEEAEKVMAKKQRLEEAKLEEKKIAARPNKTKRQRKAKTTPGEVELDVVVDEEGIEQVEWMLA